MIATFNGWFRRNMLTPDGRVVLWEHLVAWVPLPTAIGLLLSARFDTMLPLLATIMIGTGAGYYSYRQDLVATDLRQRSLLAKRGTPSKVPKMVATMGVVFLMLLAVDLLQIVRAD